MKANLKRINTVFILILLADIALRLFVTYTKEHDINSDNGILGLMARHILKGELPVFFYGQPYMGSLEAFVIAFFFIFFGISVNTMCLAMIFITTLGIISSYFLGKEIKDKTLGLYAMLIFSIPPSYIFWHGMAAFGGYPETLLFGNIILTLTLKIVKTTENAKRVKYYFWLGLISGLAFWTHMLILYYLAPTSLFLFINERKKFLFLKAALAAFPSFILGSLPFWIYNINHRFASFALPPPKYFLGGLKYLTKTIPGLISGGNPEWLVLIILLIYAVSFVFFIINKENIKIFKSPKFIFLLLFISIVYFFSSSHLAHECCPRYIMSLFTIIFVSTAYTIWYLNKKTKFCGYLLLSFILIFNGVNIYISYLQDKKESYQNHLLFEYLINFLEKNNLRTNYCVFWISQKLNFLSSEKIINSNYEGERYIPYEEIVNASGNIAFIERDTYMEPMFDMLCDNYARQKIGPFNIYYDFRTKDYCGRLIPSNSWKAVSSHNTKDIAYAFDRNADTYWGTIKPKSKNMYLELDMGSTYKIYKLALFNSNHWQNFPFDISIEVSKDKKQWEKLNIPKNPGPLFLSDSRLCWHLEDGRIELLFDPIECRYMTIRQSGEDSLNPWEINELFIWEYLGQKRTDIYEYTEIYNYLSLNNLKIVYADFWPSAKIHQLSKGRMKVLMPVNKQYPDRMDTSRIVKLTRDCAFIIDSENAWEFEKTLSPLSPNYAKKEFKNHVCFYLKEIPITNEIFFWSGYGLLKTNRLQSIAKKDIPASRAEIIFKNGIRFLGCDIRTIKDKLSIDYFWQTKKLHKNIFVFVYFMKDKNIIFQNDHPLLEQFSLSQAPAENEIFKESYTIDNVPKGTYDIVMGLWIPDKDNKRIEIVGPKPKRSKIYIETITL